ncbi:MAG: RNA 3'-terminal phosphate cyclase [Haloarculaceae archaeon]
MVEVDGSAGGGQILRTSLALSMLSGKSVTVENVRGDRPEPGLRHQHLAAVEAAAAVSDAVVEGADLGSERVAFEPGEPRGGRYEVTIDTAGSLTLVFDTIWPVATVLEEPLTLTATGGTDVKWSPTMAFCRRVKLPLLREHGLAVAVDVGRPGFYPAGGGRATLGLWPSSLSPVRLGGGTGVEARVYSLASESLADPDVAARQADTAASGLADLGVETTRREVAYAAADSPGSSLVVGLEGEGIRAGFDALGEPGKPAEDVATDAVADVETWVETPAAVDEHLADQLVVALALGGGRVATPRVTDHVETNLAVLEAFGYDCSVVNRNGQVVLRNE